MGEPEITATSYALLGLLAFGGRTEQPMTGYQLKQRADFTLRFYWVSPAMSQVYSELTRLAQLGLVTPHRDEGPRATTAYTITEVGEKQLRSWLQEQKPDFPVLKHPVALRLLMGNLSTPDQLVGMLTDYLTALSIRRAELQNIRDFLADDHAVRHPAMVADWGLHYYDSEAEIVEQLIARLAAED